MQAAFLRYARSLGSSRYSSCKVRTLSTIQQCPTPQLCCQEMPDGLDIERNLDMSNSIPSYSEQILISTGKSDWSSRIEEDESGGLARKLRALLGPKGKFNDPSRNIFVTHSSFTTGDEHQASTTPESPTSAYLLPSFRWVPSISASDDSVENFAKNVVGLIEDQDKQSEEQPPPRSESINEILVLICSHGSRDSRCGILGPILETEFKSKLASFGIAVREGVSLPQHLEPTARVGLISHIGGHKWAGNVIVAIPPHLSHPLAGKVIWYGRVSPSNVEGVVKETIIAGNVIKELFRGGIDQNRKMLRI